MAMQYGPAPVANAAYPYSMAQVQANFGKPRPDGSGNFDITDFSKALAASRTPAPIAAVSPTSSGVVSPAGQVTPMPIAYPGGSPGGVLQGRLPQPAPYRPGSLTSGNPGPGGPAPYLGGLPQPAPYRPGGLPGGNPGPGGIASYLGGQPQPAPYRPGAFPLRPFTPYGPAPVVQQGLGLGQGGFAPHSQPAPYSRPQPSYGPSGGYGQAPIRPQPGGIRSGGYGGYGGRRSYGGY